MDSQNIEPHLIYNSSDMFTIRLYKEILEDVYQFYKINDDDFPNYTGFQNLKRNIHELKKKFIKFLAGKAELCYIDETLKWNDVESY